MKRNIAQNAEDRIFRAAAPKAAFSVLRWEDVIDKRTSPVRTQRQLTAESKREPLEKVNEEMEDGTQIISDEQGDVPVLYLAPHTPGGLQVVLVDLADSTWSPPGFHKNSHITTESSGVHLESTWSSLDSFNL